MTVDPQLLADERERLAAEMRELELLIGSTRSDIERSRSREDAARARLDQARSDIAAASAADVLSASEDHLGAVVRRVTMEGQLGQLEAKRKLIERTVGLLERAERQWQEAAPREAAAPTDDRVLQAVVDTQEDERRKIARQVHDGPAQAMANVVLMSEISERLFEVDKVRSRTELAALRSSVNKTLQELRGFIFDLRPMILDDLGLVPTLRRYVQTLNEKNRGKVDLASKGRDRRLPSDDEIAVFRLLQDSMLERIDKAQATKVALLLEWKEDQLDVTVESDGRELPADGEVASGIRRGERVSLLKGRWSQSNRDGTIVLQVTLPLRPSPAMIT